MNADVVVPSSTTAGLPRPRSGGPGVGVVEHHPARRMRRRLQCRLGWHSSVFTWGPGRGVWCNHCHTRIADA